MTPEPLSSALVEALAARRPDDVVAAARIAVRTGGIPAAVALLAAAQREVGRRWQLQQWTVADEHAATAIVDLALTAAALDQPAGAPQGEPATAVVCAEGEWHTLAARMVSAELQSAGVGVVFLGASVPAEHLARFLRASTLSAVAVSCSVPIHLPGARRTIAAAHEAGVRAVAGGAGFGPTPARAAALGADAWAADGAAAAVRLAGWSRGGGELAAPTVSDAAQLALAAVRPEVLDRAIQRLAVEFPPLAHYTDAQRSRTREDLDYILQFVEAALVTGDDTLFGEFVDWLTSLLAARGLPAAVVPLSLRVLADVLPDAHPEATAILRAGADAAAR